MARNLKTCDAISSLTMRRLKEGLHNSCSCSASLCFTLHLKLHCTFLLILLLVCKHPVLMDKQPVGRFGCRAVSIGRYENYRYWRKFSLLMMSIESSATWRLGVGSCFYLLFLPTMEGDIALECKVCINFTACGSQHAGPAADNWLLPRAIPASGIRSTTIRNFNAMLACRHIGAPRSWVVKRW